MCPCPAFYECVCVCFSPKNVESVRTQISPKKTKIKISDEKKKKKHSLKARQRHTKHVYQITGSKIDDNGNAMFPSYLSKIFKEETGWRYCRTAAMGNMGKKCFSRIICLRCCTGRNLRFHVENSQHADQKQLTRR